MLRLGESDRFLMGEQSLKNFVRVQGGDHRGKRIV